MKHDRLGLSESLEEYTVRLGYRSTADARMTWRIAGLELLNVLPTRDPFEIIALTTIGLAAVAPGVRVPTSNGRTVIGDK